MILAKAAAWARAKPNSAKAEQRLKRSSPSSSLSPVRMAPPTNRSRSACILAWLRCEPIALRKMSASRAV